MKKFYAGIICQGKFLGYLEYSNRAQWHFGVSHLYLFDSEAAAIKASWDVIHKVQKKKKTANLKDEDFKIIVKKLSYEIKVDRSVSTVPCTITVD